MTFFFSCIPCHVPFTPSCTTLPPQQGRLWPTWGTGLLLPSPASPALSPLLSLGQGGGLLPTFFWLCQLTGLTEKKKKKGRGEICLLFPQLLVHTPLRVTSEIETNTHAALFVLETSCFNKY